MKAPVALARNDDVLHSMRDVLPPVRNAYGDLGRSLLDTGHHKVLLNTWTLFQSRRDTKISTPH